MDVFHHLENIQKTQDQHGTENNSRNTQLYRIPTTDYLSSLPLPGNYWI